MKTKRRRELTKRAWKGRYEDDRWWKIMKNETWHKNFYALDDGWPESVEEQGLLLLVWRHNFTNDTWKICYRQSRRGVARQNSEKCKAIVCIANTFTHRRFYTQKLLHTEAFTHRSFYTEAITHKAFTHRSFYIQTLLHTDVFTHRRFYTDTVTHRHVYTQTLLHTDLFTHRSCFYTQTLWHTEAFTHRRFYTQALLHTNTFTHRKGKHDDRWSHACTVPVSQTVPVETGRWIRWMWKYHCSLSSNHDRTCYPGPWAAIKMK